MMWSSAYCFGIIIHHILSYASLKISVNFSFPANSSHSLYPIKLKLYLYLDHDVEQRILFRGYSPPNISRDVPLTISVNFSFPANPFYSFIQSSWNLI